MELTPEQQEERREKAERHVKRTISGLRIMQRRAVINHLCGMTKTEACREAGYKHPESHQSRVFDNPNVEAAIAEYFFGEEMKAREVIGRIGQIGRGEYSRYFVEREIPVLDKDGELVGHRYVVGVDVEQMLADGLGHLIKGVKATANGQTIEFHDMFAALIQLGRYHGLFTDRTDLTSGGERLAQPVIYLPENGRGSND